MRPFPLFLALVGWTAAAPLPALKAGLQYAVIVTQSSNSVKPADLVQVLPKPIPVPGPTDVLVQVILRPIHPGDIASLKGLYPGTATLRNWTPGLEGVGIVAGIGANVKRFRLGQRVIISATATGQHPSEGTWQQYVLHDEARLLPAFPTYSNETAAQATVNPPSAFGVIDTLQPPPGAFILQTAAASVMGRILIQYARFQGLKTINVVRRPGQEAALKALGADFVIDSSSEDVIERVRQITNGTMAYGSLDSVGGRSLSTVASATRPNGTVLFFGFLESLYDTGAVACVGGVGLCAAAERPPYAGEIGVYDLLFRNVTVRGFFTSTWFESLPLPKKNEVTGRMTALLATKVVSPLAGPRFDLSDIKEAVAEVFKPNRGGKVLVA